LNSPATSALASDFRDQSVRGSPIGSFLGRPPTIGRPGSDRAAAGQVELLQKLQEYVAGGKFDPLWRVQYYFQFAHTEKVPR
jgi:hypothetical protein